MHIQTPFHTNRILPLMKMMAVFTVFCTLMAVLPEQNDLDMQYRAQSFIEPKPSKFRKSIHSKDPKFMEHRKTTEEPFPIADMYDPKLIEFVRKSIHPPSSWDVPYNLTRRRTDYSQYNQSTYLMDEVLKGMREGFFVELGAMDGETHSNSLYLEREYGWTGLLIEPNPHTFEQLLSKGRKSYAINAGASVTDRSAMADFLQQELHGVSRFTNKTADTISVRTIPLYTMFMVLNITLVDFLSLDVEGQELEVLKTIPWDKVKIRVMCIEVNHIEGGLGAVVSIMEKQGYILIDFLNIDAWFANKDLLEQTLGRKLVQSTLELNVVKLN